MFSGRNAAGFTLPPIVMAFVNLFVTFHYQPPAFWRGDDAAAIEGNHLALLAMRIHPFVLLACVIVWCIGVAFLVMRLPRRWALDLALFLVLGHGFCVGQWIVRYDEHWPMRLAMLVPGTLLLAWPMLLGRQPNERKTPPHERRCR